MTVDRIPLLTFAESLNTYIWKITFNLHLNIHFILTFVDWLYFYIWRDALHLHLSLYTFIWTFTLHLHLENHFTTTFGESLYTYIWRIALHLHLESERYRQHRELLHFKVHAYGCLVVPIKDIMAKSVQSNHKLDLSISQYQNSTG